LIDEPGLLSVEEISEISRNVCQMLLRSSSRRDPKPEKKIPPEACSDSVTRVQSMHYKKGFMAKGTDYKKE